MRTLNISVTSIICYPQTQVLRNMSVEGSKFSPRQQSQSYYCRRACGTSISAPPRHAPQRTHTNSLSHTQLQNWVNQLLTKGQGKHLWASTLAPVPLDSASAAAALASQGGVGSSPNLSASEPRRRETIQTQDKMNGISIITSTVKNISLEY